MKKIVLLLIACPVALILIAALAFWLTDAPLRAASDYLEVLDPPEKADVIVVLGTGDGPRLEWAAQLYARGLAPTILLTGYANYPPANDFARAHGMSPETVIRERNSTTTYTNATLSAPILRRLGARKVILVTSWYHSRRALQTFRKVVPDIRYVSIPASRDSEAVSRTKIAKELIGMAGYCLWRGIAPW
ncbi:MAG: YdcF family protein [Acidobacteria bacterium]|nr:YdcF family protein [Acidobacteriota bacterium]